MKDKRQDEFKQLIGETITKIDASSINVVHLYTASGKVFSIDSESSHCGIPVIQLSDYSEITKP